MKIYYLLSSALLIIFSQIENLKGDGSCGDWESFKDEKCFKLLDNVESHDVAIAFCKNSTKSGAVTLASVLSQEEQNFLENYIFKKLGSLNSVWIGAKKLPESQFAWDDENRFDYTNFDKDDKHNEGDDCLEMEYKKPETGKLGKWIDIKCNKKNQVLCQFSQSWTSDKLVKTHLSFRKEFKDSITSINNDLKNHGKYINDLNGRTHNLIESFPQLQKGLLDLKKELDSVKTDLGQAKSKIEDLNENPVPKGFIYVQLPNQPEPFHLWGTVNWTEITAEYAGLFFRVLGGGSEGFGVAQGDNSPRVLNIQVESDKGYDNRYETLKPGTWSSWAWSGSNHRDPTRNIRFYTSGGEVRPRNKAVKIWKRT